MNIRFVSVLCVALLGLSFAAEAAKKKPAAAPAATPEPAGEAPSARLSGFMKANLDAVLAPLDKPGIKDGQSITELREKFADEAAKLPLAQRPPYEIAGQVCQTMINAYMERQNSISSLKGSTAVHGDSQLGAIRADHPGDNELYREQQEQKQRNKGAKAQDAFFTTGQKTQWMKRADLYRQQIEALYAKERETERQVNAAASAAAAQPAAGAPAAPAVK